MTTEQAKEQVLLLIKECEDYKNKAKTENDFASYHAQVLMLVAYNRAIEIIKKID